MDFINRLREKSPGAKKRIAFATSAVVTLAIFGVWASVFNFGTDQKKVDATAAVINSSQTDVDPLSAFWGVLSTGWGGLVDNINQIKTETNKAQDLLNTTNVATSTDGTNSPYVSIPQDYNTQPATQPTPQSDVFILDNITQ